MSKTSDKPTDQKQPAGSQLRIGELLIKEGFITEKELQQALEIQKKEHEFATLPLGHVLIKLGVLTEDDLQEALNHPNLRKNLGSLAVEKGLISKSDLQMVLTNKKPGQLIGELLISYGLLSRDDIGRLLQEQVNSPKLGEVLVDLKIITEKDLHEALKKQKTTRALGEILCDLNMISPLDLNYVLEKYNKQIGIAEILRKLDYIDDDKLVECKKEQAQTSQPLGKILISKKFISPEQLQAAYSKKYNIPFMQLNDFAYSTNDKKQLSNIISQKYAETNLILPLSLIDKKLTLAISQPERINYANELKKLYPHLTLDFMLITDEKFEELFEILYSKKLSSLDVAEEETADPTEDIDFMEIDLNEDIDDADDKSPLYGTQDLEAEELVNFIVKYGILNNASDIHIEQDRIGPKLRYRIDGILQEPAVEWLKKKLPEKIGSIVSRIKIMSNLDIAEKRIPQDGVFRINYYDKATNQKFDLDFRVATCRAIVGENVTIRILDSRKANVGIDNLNHSPHVIDPLKKLLKSPAGMILVSGPTGSGKSSTLYGALQYVYNPGVKIITAEDPIEYSFPGIMQTQIQPKIGITFSRLLRSFLRLDPDIILVGEMRDEETSQIGFDAAQTGHLLLSTIHTNDSISAVSRLTDLNIEYSQMASSLLAVLAQRLIRQICPLCKKEYIPSEDEWGVLFDSYPSHLTFYKGEGCESCNFSGYKGRTLISEVFIVDKEIGAALNQGVSEDQIKKIALESGMKTMLDDGLLKLHDTTLSEILRVIPHDMIKTFRSRKQFQADVNDLIDNLFDGTGNQAQENLAPASFTLSDPAAERNTVESMLNKYAQVRKTLENKSEDTVDKSLFHEFIHENFNKIQQRFNCKSIRFTIQPQNGHAEISAQAQD